MADLKSILLIDGNSLLYRAHFAFIRGPLTNSKGFETSAIFGFSRMLFDLLDKRKPDYVLVAWDAAKKSFRHELFAEYKGTRKETPAPLVAQFPLSRQLLKGLGIPMVELEGYEADDILGTLAKRFAAGGTDVYLVSGDRDILQLVGDRITAIMTKKGISELALYGPEEVKKDFGMDPLQLVDYKGLAGDTSDNIPGVAGIGEKTAVKLIGEYGNLEGIYAAIDTIKGAMKKKLEESREKAFLSRTLGTIKVDAPVPLELDACTRLPADPDTLMTLFSELELRQFLSRPELKAAVKQAVAPKVEVVTVSTEAAFAALLSDIEKASAVGVAPQMSKPQGSAPFLTGLGLAVSGTHGYYIPLRHQYLGVEDQLSVAVLATRLSAALAGRAMVGEDLKGLSFALAADGIQLGNLSFDTMIASYLLNPGRRSHAIGELAAEFLGRHLAPIEEVVPKGCTIHEIPIARAAEHGGVAAAVLVELHGVLAAKLTESDLASLFTDIEIPLIPILADMQRTGIMVDPAYLQQLGREFATEMKTLESEIHRQCGEEFNVNSPSQLARILFEKLGYPVIRKTKTGYSTDAEVLQALEHDHQLEVAKLINQYRHLSKLKGTYIDTLPALIHPATGRIHASYHQTVAATGRLSCSDPNLQNIPIRTEVGVKIRRAFLAAPGHVFLAADYSQIELRILAHLCGSEFLRQAFVRGEDIHRQTAARMFGVAEAEVGSDLRSRAKAINFGILYGMSAFGLSREVGITQGEAKAFMESYFAQFPEVKAYQATQLAQAREKGYVTTLLRRRRYLPQIQSSNGAERQFAERIAINTPIQGSAADLVKVAMIRVVEQLSQSTLKAKMLLQIHDELVFETPVDELEPLGRLVKTAMESALSLTVPIDVQIGTGPTWADLK